MSMPETLLDLTDDAVAWRLLLAQANDMTWHAALGGSGNPAHTAGRIFQRISNPREGDLVYEWGSLIRYRHQSKRNEPLGERWKPEHIVGRLLRIATEASMTAEEWLEDGGLLPVPTERVWYVQYGPSDEDVVRWTNCSFRAIVLDEEDC